MKQFALGVKVTNRFEVVWDLFLYIFPSYSVSLELDELDDGISSFPVACFFPIVAWGSCFLMRRLVRFSSALLFLLSHTTSLTTTSLRQRFSRNITHTTSLTTTSRTQRFTHHSTHTTSFTLTGAAHLVAGTALCCLPRGSDVRSGALALDVQISSQAQALSTFMCRSRGSHSTL